MTSTATKILLAYSMLKGVGPAKLRLLAARGASVLEALGFGSSEPVGIPGIDSKIANPSAWAAAQEEARRQVDAAERTSSHIISVLDPAYPALLAATKDDPCILFVQGTLPAPSDRIIAVVGTRQPTRHGEIIAKRIAEYLVGEGAWVVSGLAIGCDSIAHQTCIAEGGRTIAVLAHGLQTVAPAQNRKLAEEIVDSGGLLLTEYGFGVEPIPQQFVRRDGTQAGLSEGVVMVQSDLTGGSLHASRASLKHGRWLAVPAPTEADRAANAAKIQANLLLVEGTDSERMMLLDCGPELLQRLRILRSRDDYGRLLSTG